MEVPREAVPLLFSDLDHPEALGRKLGRELDVLERDACRAGERHRVALLLGVEGAALVVDRLENAQAAAVAGVDRDNEDRPGAVPGARIDARIKTRVLIRFVYTKELAGAGHFRREAAPVERQADLADRRDTLAAFTALRERA